MKFPERTFQLLFQESTSLVRWPGYLTCTPQVRLHEQPHMNCTLLQSKTQSAACKVAVLAMTKGTFFFPNAVTKHLKQAENGQTSLLCTHAASFRNAITLDKGDYCQV